MKLNVEKAKSSAVQTGLVMAGVVAGHAISKKMPEKFARFAPVALLAAGVLAPALSESKQLSSVALGVATVGALSAVNNFTGSPETAVGMKGMIAKWVPQLAGVPSYSLGSIMYGEQPLAQSLLGAGETSEAIMGSLALGMGELRPDLIGASML